MEQVFISVVNRSIAASWLILAVLIARVLLRRAPKWSRCALWALVGLRLICPEFPQSGVSLIPSVQTIPQGIEMSPAPALETGVSSLDGVLNPLVTEVFAPNPAASANPLQIWFFIGAVLWIGGMAVMALYALVSYLRVRAKFRVSMPLRDNILLCDDIDSPFLLGLFRPRIYLPSAMEEAHIPHVLAHERSHLSRMDHWWKPIGFAILTVHWFNPLVWLSYVLLCRDIELACDERVIRTMEAGSKKAYSEALLSCSVGHRLIAACPLAFGEVSVKERVKSILHYKKPAFWLMAAALVLCVLVGVFFLTDPVELPDPGPLNPDIDWGITMEATNVGPTGMTLVITQSGGYPLGSLMTGSPYGIEKKTENGWEECPVIIDNLAWTMIGLGIPRDNVYQMSVNWEDIYGMLEPGTYRIGKNFSGQYKTEATPMPGEWIHKDFYAEFTLEAIMPR